MEELINSGKDFLGTLPPWVYAIIIGVAASFWKQFKSVFSFIFSLVIVGTTLDLSEDHDMSLFRAFLMSKKFKPIMLSQRFYASMPNQRKLENVEYRDVIELLSRVKLYLRYYIVPIWFGNLKSKENEGSHGSSKGKSVVYTIRFLISIKKLLFDFDKYIKDKDIEHYLAENLGSAYSISHRTGTLGSGNSSNSNKSMDDTDDELLEPSRGGPSFSFSLMNKLNYYNLPHTFKFLNADADKIGYYSSMNSEGDNYYYFSKKEKLLKNEIVIWLKNKKWFDERGLPYKRGYLFYGKPGTGKTTFIRNICQELKIPIVVFSLATFTNSEFPARWKRALKSFSGIVAILFEDIDAVFSKRDNKNKSLHGEHLTFDTLLNTIDGVQTDIGRLLFITTNHIEEVDEALSVNRPGRVDSILEFNLLEDAGKKIIAEKILRDEKPVNEILADKKVGIGNDTTHAIFVESCIKKAFELFNNDKL